MDLNSWTPDDNARIEAAVRKVLGEVRAIVAALPGTAFTKTDPELRDGSVDDSAGAGGSSLSPEAARALMAARRLN